MSKTHYINANLLDGEHAARSGATVTVEGNRVVAVGDRLQPAASDAVVDLGGRTLMPGMITGHFHAGFHNIGAAPGVLAGMEKPPIYMGYRAMASAQSALRAGFTGIVGAGCALDIDASMDMAIRDGLFVGPRVVPCSRDFESSADASTFAPWWLRTPEGAGVIRCADGPDDYRRKVRQEIDRGARMIKVYVTGGHGIQVPKSVEIADRDELEAAVNAAHARGARVRVHISTKARILHAVACGVDVLDHADEIDDECIEAIVKAGVFVLPSLYYSSKMMAAAKQALGTSGEMFTQEDHADFKNMCAQLPKAVAAGVRLCVGDDFGAPIIPHGEYGKELAVYVQHAGIAPLEVIRWATRNGGLLMGHDDLGTIAPGKLADMVVVDGDPSQDIHLLGELDRILAVVKDGRLVSGAFPIAGSQSMRNVA